jgi:hypothetical protein
MKSFGRKQFLQLHGIHLAITFYENQFSMDQRREGRELPRSSRKNQLYSHTCMDATSFKKNVKCRQALPAFNSAPATSDRRPVGSEFTDWLIG